MESWRLAAVINVNYLVTLLINVLNVPVSNMDEKINFFAGQIHCTKCAAITVFMYVHECMHMYVHECMHMHWF